ncbi:hypothetical protein NSK_008367 [Nannochloropsis salina CCMP1776]|uniref:Plastid lipid-associated protein/fibrillin conserved domain-containing protein n=1 Tax=Nannochloropsis salina CCMP1776 TaxID=1027361 RepID=A0A4D9CNY0_9STRA|nr:hypothetical protein NSK_008367 [Nannochloropsis salina CCMP1776]|eukprot:TFJ80224.1 hypothetical protein NSK_008367 [Nannochloropsis salina CCMP1776]
MLSVLVLIAFSALSSAFKLSSRTAFNVADGKPPTPTSLPAALASWPLTLGASRKSPRVLPNTENSLLQAIQGLDRREVQNSVQAQGRVSGLIKELEAAKGIPKATTTREINGKWRLLYTSSDSTASPIQNTFVGNKAFAVYQDIDIAPSASSSAPGTVTNIVDFGGAIGALNVQALASTPARPIPNFAPRLGDGRFFGLNILGISKTEVPRDSDPDDRIDFKFDNAGFDLGLLPFRIPYPVPFRLLNDEVKGWLEVTYLSGRLRVSRGNKGTIFVLEKVEES